MTRIAALILLGLVATLAILSIKVVGDGEVRLVGRGPDAKELRSGVNLVRPFTAIRQYRLVDRYQLEGKDRLAVPLKRGRRASLDCTLDVRLERGKVARLDRDYEGKVLDNLLKPLLARELAAEFMPGGDLVPGAEATIAARLNQATRPLGIEITAVRLGDVQVEGALPKGLARGEGRKVFILGFDALDWMLVDLVGRSESLPNFQRIRREGSWGNLRSMEPLVSPLIWTTMATGVTPDVHGIIDFLVKDPATDREIPATSDMRRVPALWNIASLFGLRTGFVGWLATYPAEEVEGYMVSDRVAYHMFDPTWQLGKTEAPDAGLAYPPELLDRIRPLFVEPTDVRQELAAYVHGPIGELTTKFDRLDPVSNLRLVISGYETYDAIMERLYAESRPDLAGVYFEFTDSACHLFMRYMKPAMSGVTAEEATRYGDGVAAAYREADRILGSVLAMLDDRTVLLVVSDHGFKSGDMRPLSDSRIGIGQAVSWHRLNGAIAVYGPGVKPGHEIAEASVLDVAPTVLNLLGLPVGKTMPGKALIEMLDGSWTEAHPVRFTAKYDSLFVQHGAVPAASPADQALKDKLQSLGYLAGGNASLVNMANFYQTNGRFAEAAEVWKQLLAKDTEDAGARVGLANAYFEIGKQDSAIAELRLVLRMDPRNMMALRSLATIYVRQGAGKEALAVAEEALRIDPNDGQSHFNRGLALELLGRQDQAVAEYQMATRFAPDLAEPYANLAQIYLDAGMASEALLAAQRGADLAPDKPEMHFVLGQALEAGGKGAEALGQYMSAVRLNPRFAPAYVGACGMLVAEGKVDSAIAMCDRALGATTDYPQYLHNTKGTAYLAARNFKGARQEFQAALAADGAFVPARINLARAYIAEGKTGDARRELQTVLASQPSNSEARTLLNGIR